MNTTNSASVYSSAAVPDRGLIRKAEEPQIKAQQAQAKAETLATMASFESTPKEVSRTWPSLM